MEVRERLARLREVMREEGLAGYVVHDADPHLSEYPPEHWKVRSYFSGFEGSAGVLVVTQDRVGLWTDSRYFLEAEAVLEGTGIELFREGTAGVPWWGEWVAQEVGEGGVVGFDGRVWAKGVVDRLRWVCGEAGVRVRSVDLAGRVWKGRPPLPAEPVWLVPEARVGMSRREKLRRVREELERMEADWVFLAGLDEVCWLCNIRGGDVAYNPVALGYALVGKEEGWVFLQEGAVGPEVRAALERDGWGVRGYGEVEEAVRGVWRRVWLDPERVPAVVWDWVQGEVVEAGSPVAGMKVRKTRAEREGFEGAMVWDGRALVRFVRWLEGEWEQGRVYTERELAGRLAEERKAEEGFICESFAPIVGFGPNGAVVHYNPARGVPARVEGDGLLLVDSGAHYRWGSTDITRVFCKGTPTEEQRRDYTLVLKAHIALASTAFPAGLSGFHLDVLARGVLARHGLGYGHGTGHGVGHVLCVHEGPISFRPDGKAFPLDEGMVLSIEPGVYRPGKWGVRLENLVWVEGREQNEFGRFLGFRPLTLFPFERSLIVRELLTHEELAWLDDYHRMVWEVLGSALDGEDARWLEARCRSL
ncbi:peptidase M24 [Spirochaeta thermophila DSM 6578]|uniref:Peptidase M24 n=1 Tax=Winmispira thermophila (strain ATCC 700085 / DSM 6578 / Z-1203) TaxID=869211 RepID=G0GF59_WINT7|nr:M24 family metallopeptidase [Spirochaeta thermophila]AEJ60758.1 peptidase M24 [Spirochaeta thermophila DSM 6578]